MSKGTRAPRKGRKPLAAGGKPNASESQIEEALRIAVWRGSSRVAAKETGWDEVTIRRWKTERPEQWSALEHAHLREIADGRPAMVRKAAAGLEVAIASSSQALVAGACETCGQPPLALRERVAAGSFLLDSVAQLDRIVRLDRGEPTESLRVTGGPAQCESELEDLCRRDRGALEMLERVVTKVRAER